MVGKPILVVEDDFGISHTLRMILTSWSWEPQAAYSLEEGRRALMTGTFRHMILDLMLPDGDGSILLREIQNLGLSIRVIVASAIGCHREVELIKAGASRVLTKPYRLELLQEALIAPRGTIQ